MRCKENKVMLACVKEGFVYIPQATRCYDTETVSMLMELIKYKTKLAVKEHSTDSNG